MQSIDRLCGAVAALRCSTTTQHNPAPMPALGRDGGLHRCIDCLDRHLHAAHLVRDDEHLVGLHVAPLPGAKPGVCLRKGGGALRNRPLRQLLRKDGVPAGVRMNQFLCCGYMPTTLPRLTMRCREPY
jgi:hypothetical protein